jgi:thiol-disulfide isomerase/thioredoxin
MYKICTALLLFALLLSSASAQKMRTWTSASGKTIEAAYVSSHFGEVILQPPEGDKVRIRLNQLSSADQIFIGSQGASGAATQAEVEATPALVDLFGSRLVNAKGKSVSTAELNGKKIGIYFSASWCPPCRKFTPMLVEAYGELQAEGKPFEVVLVSHDRDKKSTRAYMKSHKMPWLAVPFKDKHREALKKKYGVQGIPTLVIIDAEGKTLSNNARGEVMKNGAQAFDNW